MTGQVQRSTATGQLALPNLSNYFPRTCHIIPGFNHTLLGVGPICNANCTLTFICDAVVVRGATNRAILTEWRKEQAPYLWRIALLPENADIPEVHQDASRFSLLAYSAYDLPSVEALVGYFHAAAGLPVWSTWLDAIKSGNYSSWPGLTLTNAMKYCPSTNETILGHLVQGQQGVRSTRRERRGARSPATPSTMPAPTGETKHKAPDNQPSYQPSKDLNIQVRNISKLYTDDTGRFPVRACSGNQYVMIAYHCDLNVILACPFNSARTSIDYGHTTLSWSDCKSAGTTSISK